MLRTVLLFSFFITTQIFSPNEHYQAGIHYLLGSSLNSQVNESNLGGYAFQETEKSWTHQQQLQTYYFQQLHVKKFYCKYLWSFIERNQLIPIDFVSVKPEHKNAIQDFETIASLKLEPANISKLIEIINVLVDSSVHKCFDNFFTIDFQTCNYLCEYQPVYAFAEYLTKVYKNAENVAYFQSLPKRVVIFSDIYDAKS